MGHKAYFYKLKNILQNQGEEGTTEYERYIDLPSEIPLNTRWTLYQLSFFSDDDQLAAYALNEYNEGKFIGVSKLPKTVKAELISMIEDFSYKLFTENN